jgi:hypothetical protein
MENNWFESMKLQLNPSMYHEREIRLFKNVPVQILDIEIDRKSMKEKFESEGREGDWNIIRNKTFYA